jgi:hypothetical protein
MIGSAMKQQPILGPNMPKVASGERQKIMTKALGERDIIPYKYPS